MNKTKELIFQNAFQGGHILITSLALSVLPKKIQYTNTEEVHYGITITLEYDKEFLILFKKEKDRDKAIVAAKKELIDTHIIK